jgi:hypothetical protein
MMPLPCFTRGLLLFGLLAVAGCSGSSGSDNTLSGKVTLNGQPVGGLVVLVGTDGKEQPAISTNPNGTYTAADVPRGKYTVLVKPFPDAEPGKFPVAGVEPGKLPRDVPAGTVPRLSSRGVTPPVKYAKGDTGLTVTVTAGPQTYDIPLSP